jgi:hypothetical protein
MTAFESTTSRLVQQELGACALIQDLLPLYIEGEVTPASRDLIAEHLEHCERCTGFLAGARSTREQLRRENTLRETSVAQDWAARQAIIVGQRRVMAVVLGVFGVLCLVVVAGVISIGLFKTPAASAPVPLPVFTDGAMDPSEEQPLEDELHRRAMEEAGLLYWDPRTNQYIEQNPGPWPMPTLMPSPTPLPAPQP